MTFLAPHFLWIGLAFSAAVAAVHFIVTRQPRSDAFPTARFVPATSVEAVSRSRQPSDLLLLLLRLFAILSAAIALARPVLTTNREHTARIILADGSAAARDIADVRDSASKYFRPTDLLILFDSSARIISGTDSVRATSIAAGRLSTALIVGLRSAAKLRERADSISLTVVSALPAASWDAATDTIRSLWPGSIQIVHVAPRMDSARAQPKAVHADFTASDPLRFAVALASGKRHAASVRIVRGDSVVPPRDDEMVLHWPSSSRPHFASSAPDIQHPGVVVGTTVILGSFTTRFAFTEDSLAGATVIARWIDGSPAAVQRTHENGCIRSTNIPVPQKGDLVIRSEFVVLVERFMAPCAPVGSTTTLADSLVLKLKGGTAAASRSAFPTDDEQVSPFSFWLLLAALIFLAVEQVARRARSVRTVEPGAARTRTAA